MDAKLIDRLRKMLALSRDKSATDPVGPRNSWIIAEQIAKAQLLVMAGGNPSPRLSVEQLNGAIVACAQRHNIPVRCLGYTAGGSPKHPLARGAHRVPDDVTLRTYPLAVPIEAA